MTPDNISKLAGSLAGLVTVLLGFLTYRELQRQATRKAAQETTKERTDRESSQREGELKRYDDGMWKRQDDLVKTVERLEQRVESLETRLQAEQVTTIELRADLAVANGTIRDLTNQNQRQAEDLTRLRSQITALQGKGYRGSLSNDDEEGR